MKLTIVTASVAPLPEITNACFTSWGTKADNKFNVIYVLSNANEDKDIQSGDSWTLKSKEILGVVPAFNIGIQKAKDLGADIIACFHDDLEILQQGWDSTVINFFESNPNAHLAGFGGATGLGTDDIYKIPYRPHQLARQNFYSNMNDAEVHGKRSIEFIQCACFDGFSQIGRTKFISNAYSYLNNLGIVHHAYDSAIGALAYRDDLEAWLIPIRCIHYGGVTAVGSQAYQEWALKKIKDGDQGFWQESHKILYAELMDVLPIRIINA